MRRLVLAFALLATPAWAGMPTFVANGAATVTAGTGTCTPSMPSTILADDILIVVSCGEGNDDGVGHSLTTANGFASFSNNGADDNDALEENPELDCRIFWKRAVGGDAAPVLGDSGDHTTCAVHQFRGVRTTSDPWNVLTSGNDGAANDITAVVPGGTTTADDVLVVLIQGTSNNATSTSNCGLVTNADLATITEHFDSTNTSGLGGGHCMITGEKAAAGTFGDSTLTLGATTFKAAFAVGLEGAVQVGCGTTIPLTGAGCN